MAALRRGRRGSVIIGWGGEWTDLIGQGSAGSAGWPSLERTAGRNTAVLNYSVEKIINN